MKRWIGWGVWLAAGCANGTEQERSEMADLQAEGGQYGESEDDECQVVGRTPIGLGDATPLGFTAQSIVDQVVGTRNVVVNYEAGGSTPAVLDVQLGSTIELLEFAQLDTGDTSSGCLPGMSIALQVVFSSDDGAFDEAFDDEAVAYVAEASSMSHPFDAFVGTFDPLAVAGAAYSEVEARLEIGWSPTGLTDGEIDGSGIPVADPQALQSLQFATIVEAP